MPAYKTVALAGVIAIEVSVGVTVMGALLLIMPAEVAVIFVLPPATAVTNPDATIAAAGFEDDQTAVVVRFCVLPSL